jgi:hypothetical protein
LSSEALDVTMKFVLILANILNLWKITNKWAQTPPIIQNCSLLHHASIPTLDHCILKRHVAKIDRNREINHKLAELLIFTQKKSALNSIFFINNVLPNSSWFCN